MPNVNDVYGSDYLGGKDFEMNKTVECKMLSAELAELKNQSGTDHKVVIGLDGYEKWLVLNKTNAKAIASILGDETDQWIGHYVSLTAQFVNSPNGRVPGISVAGVRVNPDNGKNKKK